MAADIPTTEPVKITAGDTLRWTKSVSDYSAAAGWTLDYYFRGKAGSFDITTTADGSDHAVSVAKTITAAYPAGDYYWAAYVSKAGERFQVGAGRCKVLPDLITKNKGYDGRSHVKKTLDAIEAVLEGRASKDQESYTIDSISLSRTPIKDLIMFQAKYAAAYQAELDAETLEQGGKLGGKILTRFT